MKKYTYFVSYIDLSGYGMCCIETNIVLDSSEKIGATAKSIEEKYKRDKVIILYFQLLSNIEVEDDNS